MNKDSPAKAAIPFHLLSDLYMPHKVKLALAEGLCPECESTLELLDTLERVCSTPTCGYTFNWYDWPQFKR